MEIPLPLLFVSVLVAAFVALILHAHRTPSRHDDDRFDEDIARALRRMAAERRRKGA